MQLFAQILQAGWHDLLGLALIVAGIALAVQTLGIGPPKSGAAHILRAYRPAEWSARQRAHELTRPMDPTSQWHRLTAIAEKGFTQIELIGDLHARAAEELEAVDEALVRLLAEYTPGLTLPAQERDVLPAPTPTIQPLAA
jgi:hypothetical protein